MCPLIHFLYQCHSLYEIIGCYKCHLGFMLENEHPWEQNSHPCPCQFQHVGGLIQEK